MTYEEALRRLDEIVRALEGTETELADAVRLYEEGKKLLTFCDEQLRDAEQKVTVLEGEDVK